MKELLSPTPGTRRFGDWWRENPMSKSRPELYGICEAVWLAASSESEPPVLDLMAELKKKLAEPSPSDKQGEPDGYAVLMDDKASAPAGFWFCGIWNTKEVAEQYAAKQKGVRMAPMFFASSAIGAPDEHPLTVEIIGSELRISVGIKTMAEALHRLERWPEEFVIVDPVEFGKDVLRELNREEEDGSTPVHRLLDKVGIAALDQGSIGVEEKSSASTDGGTNG